MNAVTKITAHSEQYCTGSNSVAGHCATLAPQSLFRTPEVDVQHFLHSENIALYRRLIAESERDPSRDEKRHAMLLTLLAEEEARDRSRQLENQSLAFAPSFFRR